MDKPKTYSELIAQKRCFELCKYYDLSDIEVNKIYDFLIKNKEGYLECDSTYVSLKKGHMTVMRIPQKLKNFFVNDIYVSNEKFKVNYIIKKAFSDLAISMASHSGSGGWSSGGSSGFGGGSSNNNNNNNNNNNR